MFAPSKLPASVTPNALDRDVGEVRDRRADLLRRPDVELALDALAVGIQGRREAALVLAQLAHRPVERLLAHAPEQRLLRHLERVQVRPRQQRVVVEHLLEVRHEPAGVDGVAREAAADLVVDAAGGHPAQGLQRHRDLAARQQELDHRGRGELRRPAPAAVGLVELPPQSQHGGGQDRLGDLGFRRLHERARPGAAARSSAPPRRSPRAASSTRSTRRPAGPSTTASGGAARAGSRCRRRTARRRASGTRSAATRPGRSSPARRPCRSRRRPGAPRGRP